MKRRSLAVMVYLILIMAAPLAVRAQGSGVLGFWGGLDVPMGGDISYKDYGKNDYCLGFEFSFGLSDWNALRLSASMFNLGFDNDEYENWAAKDAGFDSVVTEGGNTRFLTISANFVQYIMPPSLPVRFYLCAGGGYYHQTVEALSGTIHLGGGELPFELPVDHQTLFDVTNNLVGFNGGVGVVLALGNTVAMFLEGDLHYLLTENEKTTFFTATGGLRIALW